MINNLIETCCAEKSLWCFLCFIVQSLPNRHAILVFLSAPFYSFCLLSTFSLFFCSTASRPLMKKALSLFIIFNSSVLLYAQCHFLLSLLILIRIEKGNWRHFTVRNLWVTDPEFPVHSVELIPSSMNSMLFFCRSTFTGSTL